ncbi:conserved hypothetical protein [Ancylobacter novellus DSM 506]|uniref:Uncharacterized protein n=1 Tax=Ancylobacter novellus (strain ATCC 8093 / DSM 506 / JCM 20403 / CCM 1077 / IAM 12100 / NBRC 12443 / NCIMB 10456) TaxID=639283 RepID=D7A3Z0_ANCN5|nr:hypothetical protein [Ancylobacter novellus]ADH91767.1 conserved hypothetical protein [Ancylobacter novellus DSM 506]
MEQALREHLLSCFSVFVEARGITSATVGRLAAGDWRFFRRLADGTNFTVRKYDEVMAWFSTNWPAGAEWPAKVPRPYVPPILPAAAPAENGNRAEVLP